VPLAAFAEAIFLGFFSGGQAEGVLHTQRNPPAPRRSVVAGCRPRNGFGALSPRSFSPRRFMPQLFCCSALCPFRWRRSVTVMMFRSSPPSP
jgi:hypothetical protein